MFTRNKDRDLYIVSINEAVYLVLVLLCPWALVLKNRFPLFRIVLRIIHMDLLKNIYFPSKTKKKAIQTLLKQNLNVYKTHSTFQELLNAMIAVANIKFSTLSRKLE